MELAHKKHARLLTRQTLQIYWKALWRRWQYTVPLLFTNTPSHILTEVVQPYAISQIIGSLAQQHPNTSRAMHYFWLWLIAAITFSLLLRVIFYVYNRLQINVQRDLDYMCFQAFSQLDQDFFANQFTGALVTKVSKFNNGFEKISDTVTDGIDMLIVQLVGALIIIGSRSSVLALVVLATTLAILVTTQLTGRYRIPLIRKGALADSKVSGFFADFLTNILSVKSFVRFDKETHEFNAVTADRFQKRIRSRNMGELIRTARSVVVDSFQAVVLVVIIYQVGRGALDIATAVLMQIYLFKITESLWSLNNIANSVQETLGNAAEMTEILLRQPRVNDTNNPQKPHIYNGGIVFKDVSFKYADQLTKVRLFHQLNIAIKPGEKIGLVGPSGGGKTTITKLLLRFMDIEDGEILIDDQNIATITQDDLRRHIAYVPQEPLLFHRSIYENIAYGDPSASKAAIEKAARLAHAEEFIKALPNGYQTLVGERGVKLSGGEKQRIAIARAMLKKAPVLILDEATSALDSKSEKAIVAALDNLMQGRTTIVIAHRLSTIRKLDRIIVLKDGDVAETGTHKQLLARKGIYSELWQHQSGEFL